MKERAMIFLTICIIVVVILVIALVYILNIIPHNQYENIDFNRLSRQSWNGLRNNYISETCCFKKTGKSTVKSVAKPNKGS